MISRINPYGTMDTPSPLSKDSRGSDFKAVLSTYLDCPDSEQKTLDLNIISFLNGILDHLLSKDSGQDNLSFGPVPLLGLLPSVPASAPGLSNKTQLSQDFEPVAQQAAQKYGLDPALVKAVIMAESKGDPKAVSPAGAEGLMQLMPSTAAELGVRDPFDPADNVMAGARYLKKLLDRYQGNTKLALAAYNWGMGNLERRPEAMPKETRQYIARIQKYYHQFSTA